MSEYEDCPQLSRELVSIYIVELAVKFKNSAFVAQTLKDDDALIAKRILKAIW